eukprot:Nitzschia sp. Nitz4//scaffold192_size41448//28781//29893//NITZ4_007487-RA/size41448-processed-gene-0.32-mRNA-1//-1//CDS//3329540242//9225//frame0
MEAPTEVKLPAPLTTVELYARAFWDPNPTTSVKSQRQLAYALGYPADWRVERVIEDCDGKPSIRDRIHATFGKTKKQQCKLTWLHHEAARAALAQLEAGGTVSESHLLPPVPLYAKGDLVQVQWEGKWYQAVINKRKKQADDFLYSVYYIEDNSTQDGVEESDIRPGEDPIQLAKDLGFPTDWKASRNGSKYVYTSPTGDRFTTKKAALQFIKKQQEAQAAEEEDMGDPPWRTEGHEWIGRQVSWSTSHKVSGTRKIQVEQVGTITGYIKDTDLDKMGNPGFVSEQTSEPANLFHVVFPDEPHHQYASHLLNSQDLEENEVSQNLLEETPAAKRKREAALSEEKSPSKKPTPSKKARRSTTPKSKRRRSR